MRIFGTSHIGCQVLLWLLVVFGLVMMVVYHDGGYAGSTEPVVVLGGCSAGALFCLFQLFKQRRKRAA